MINLKQFKTLAEVRGEHCISFFVPTHRAGHIREDPIRYKNMVSKVANKLEERGVKPMEIKEKLKEAKAKKAIAIFMLHRESCLYQHYRLHSKKIIVI